MINTIYSQKLKKRKEDNWSNLLKNIGKYEVNDTEHADKVRAGASEKDTDQKGSVEDMLVISGRQSDKEVRNIGESTSYKNYRRQYTSLLLLNNLKKERPFNRFYGKILKNIQTIHSSFLNMSR